MIHESATARTLGIARITVYGIWLIIVTDTSLSRFADLPRELYVPVGPFRFLPAAFHEFLLSIEVLKTLKIALVSGLLLLVLGARPHVPIAICTTILVVIFDGAMKAFSDHVNHAQLVALYAALIVSIFPAADGLSAFGKARQSRRLLYSAPMLAVAVVLCLTYTFIGVHRLTVNGPEIFTGDAIIRYLAMRSLERLDFGFEFGLLPLSYPILVPLLKVGFAMTTAFEIMAPVCLVYRRFRWIWIVATISLHVSTLLLMNILFWENMVLIIIFLTPLAYWKQPHAATLPEPVMPLARAS